MSREGSPPRTYMCQTSCVMCHFLCFMCLMSHVTCHMFFLFLFRQSCEASRWRVTLSG